MFQSTSLNRDKYFNLFLKINGLFSAFVVFFIFIFLLKESFAAFDRDIFSYFLDESWFPTEGQFNMAPMIIGSLLVTFGSIVIAFPLGLFSALYISYYCPNSIRSGFRKVIELYTGIPSVIFGFWGLMKVVPIINEINPPGQSLIAGIIILALMIFPIISLSLVAAFEMSSKTDYNVSRSLNIRKSKYIWVILLPSLKKQIVGSVFLSLGRAIGETMAVLMVCGNIVQIPESIFSPIRTLTANIALEMSYAMGVHRSSLFLTGLLLLIIIIIFFFISDMIQKIGERWSF